MNKWRNKCVSWFKENYDWISWIWITTCEVIQIRLLLASKTRNLCSKGTAELNSTMTSLLSCGLSLFVLRGDPCKKSQVLSVAYGGLRSRVFPDLWSYLSIHKLKFLDRCIHTQKRYSCENLLMQLLLIEADDSLSIKVEQNNQKTRLRLGSETRLRLGSVFIVLCFLFQNSNQSYPRNPFVASIT